MILVRFAPHLSPLMHAAAAPTDLVSIQIPALAACYEYSQVKNVAKHLPQRCPLIFAAMHSTAMADRDLVIH